MMKTYLHLIVIFCFFFLSSVKAKADKMEVILGDTIIIKFGQYYIDNGEANLPVMQIYDVNSQTSISSLKNEKEYLIEVNSGLFDRYNAKAEILSSNGQVKKAKGPNRFLLTAKRESNEEMLELKITHDLNGDIVKVVTREWSDEDKIKFTEEIKEFAEWEQTIWLKIK